MGMIHSYAQAMRDALWQLRHGQPDEERLKARAGVKATIAAIEITMERDFEAPPEERPDKRAEKATYIDRVTRWLMPTEPELLADVMRNISLSGLYTGRSRNIHRLILVAYCRGVRKGASSAWDARQPIVLRTNPVKERAVVTKAANPYKSMSLHLALKLKPDELHELCCLLDGDSNDRLLEELQEFDKINFPAVYAADVERPEGEKLPLPVAPTERDGDAS